MASIPAQADAISLRSTRRRYGERVILLLLAAAGGVSILTTVGIIYVLFSEAIGFFQEISIVRFLTETAWEPFRGVEGQFGIWPLVTGTLLVTSIAMLVAVPLGVGAAIYLAEYAPARVRGVLKPTLEVLAGVPTIVLGYFAVTFMTPLLRGILGADTVSVFNAASAGIVMGIMIIPTVASLSEDAMSAVPAGLRESAYGLGASKRHVALRVIVPAALSGIVAAIILGMSRGIGETMIVALAAGNLPSLTLNPFDQIQTMTAYILQAVGGESPRGSLTYTSLFAVGAALFVMTFSVNVLAQRFVRRFRQAY